LEKQPLRKKQLDILMISYWDFQEYGMQAILRTPLYFAEKGHKVTFLVHSEQTAKPSNVKALHPNIVVHRFDLPFKFLRCLPKVNRARQLLLFAIYSLLTVLRTYSGGRKPDVIYAAECDAILIGTLLRRVYRVPLIARYYGISTILLERPFKHVLYYLCVKRASDMAIVTDDGTNGVAQMRRRNSKIPIVKFWRNGIDRPQLDPKKIATICQEHGIQDDDFVLMTNSRLYGWKRVDRAIRMMASLVKMTCRPVKLLIVGHGPERSKLQALSQELGVRQVVRFAGAVHHHDIYNYYAAADVLLSLYDMSNLGNPTWEALNIGRGIVALNCGVEDAVIKNGENGILVDIVPDEAELAKNLAKAVKRLAEDEEYSERVASGAKAFAERNLWTWDERLEAETKAIEALVNDRSRSCQ